MPQLRKTTEARITEWKARNGINILRFSLGFIFLWFGILKFFPGLSPAELLAGKTISKITLGLIKPSVAMPGLSIWECTIGLGLITKAWPRLTLTLLYLQMAGTFLPLIFFPHQTFNGSILIPTLLGQYIIKNFVLVSGAIVVGTALQGGSLIVNTQQTKIEIEPALLKAKAFDEDYIINNN